MSLAHSTNTVTNGLVFAIDPANTKSYVGSGTAWKDMVGRVSGTLVNSPTFSSNNLGYFTFNGSNQYANFGDIDALTFTTATPFSTSFWFKTGASGVRQVISKWGYNSQPGWEISMNNGVIRKYLTTAGYGGRIVQTTSNFNDNAWHHGVVTYDGSNNSNGITFYVDTALAAKSITQNSDPGDITNTKNVFVGARNDGAPVEYYSGILSNIFVYNKELATTEITQIFEAYRGRYGI